MVTPLVKPATMLQPFANIGGRNVIPNTPDATPGHASYDLGFPPLTRTPIQSGGVPPSGLDMNGLGFDVSSHTAWLNGGGQYTFDAALATFTGGYKFGAVLQSDDGLSSYVSIANNNTTNFNTTPSSIGTQWLAYAGKAAGGGSATVATTGGVTVLTAAQYNAGIVIVGGALVSDATLTFPTQLRGWIVINNTTGAFNVTAIASGGTGVPILQGGVDNIVCDGTNMRYKNSSAVTPAIGDSSKRIATTEFIATSPVSDVALSQLYYMGQF